MRAICADKTYRGHLRRSTQNENSSSTDAAAETVASLRPPSYRDHTGRRTASYPPEIWCLHLSVRPQIWCLHLSVSTGTWCLHLSLDFSWSVYYKSAPAWSCFLCPTLYYLRLKYSGQLWPRSYLTWTGRLRAVTGGYTGGYYPGL